MTNKINIHNLFPIPILETKIPQKYSNIVKFFDSQEMEKEKVDFSNYGFRSKNINILDLPECKSLKKYILDIASKYSYNILGYDYKKYKFSLSWISHKEPNTQHQRHTHANSIISGVFFYGNFDKNTPSLNFHAKSTNYEYTNCIQLKRRLDSNKKFYDNNITVKFTPGLLLLFPSYLPHSVPSNSTTKTRKSLAFNIVPKKGFGDSSSLTKLKF